LYFAKILSLLLMVLKANWHFVNIQLTRFSIILLLNKLVVFFFIFPLLLTQM